MKKLCALFLIIAMLPTLCACGGAKNAAETPQESGQTAETEVKWDYTPRFVELGGMENYLTPRCFTDTGLYATAAVMVSNNIPAGVTPEYESQYYRYEQRLYFIALDGTVRRLREYSPLVLEEERSDALYYTQSNNIAAMLMDDGGALTVLEAVDEGWYEKIMSATGKESAGDYTARQRWFIRTLDKNGAETARCEIALDRGEWLDGYKAVTDGQGNFIVIDRKGIRAVDSAGATVWKTASDAAVGNVLKTGGGGIYVLSWGDRWSVRQAELSGKTLGQPVELPMGVYTVSAGAQQELLYSEGSRLCAFDLHSGQSRSVLNWTDCDIIAESVSQLCVLENGDIAGVQTRFDQGSGGYVTELFVLERVEAGEKSDEDCLRFGTVSPSAEMTARIVAHNRDGEGRRIAVTDYSIYDDPAGELSRALRSGDGPDIIDLTGLNVPSLAAEGCFADMYPFIDADGELDRADYFENLLRSCEYEGQLISTCPGFFISTVIAAADAAGKVTAWTVEDFSRVASAAEPGFSILDSYTTREQVLATLLALCRGELINDADGSCDFQSGLFADILRFAALFPAKYDWSGDTAAADDSTYLRLKTGRQLLSAVNIYAPEDIFACDAAFEGDAAFVGYPLATGSGSALARQWGLAISAKSSAKDEAWAFLRPLFTAEYQENFHGIPALKALFEKELEAAMTVSYYTDENGEALLDDGGRPIAISRADFGDEDREGDSAESFSAVTQEQALRLRQLIEAAVRTPDHDEALFTLVRDKTGAYFNGAVGSEQACAIVQGAVSEYLKDR